MTLTQWAVNMNAWVDSSIGELNFQIAPLINAVPAVAPAQGFYDRLEILIGISVQIKKHEEAVVEKNGLEVSIAAGGIPDDGSLDNANTKIIQLSQQISYYETRVLLDYIKYPTILIA